MKQPVLHSLAEVSFDITESDLASAISPDPADAFPRVFATSRLVAFMELAASRLLLPLLEPGQLSVGVTIEATHTAATPPGSRVRATASFLGMEGKIYLFEVIAYDQAGEIGRGTHKRAIISLERLMAGAERRRSGV